MKTALVVAAVTAVAAAPVVYEYVSGPEDLPACTGDVTLFFDAVRDDRQGVNWTTVAGHADYPEVETALGNVAYDGVQGQAVIHVQRADALEQAIRDAQAGRDAQANGTVPVVGHAADRGLVIDYAGVDILYSRMVRCAD